MSPPEQFQEEYVDCSVVPSMTLALFWRNDGQSLHAISVYAVSAVDREFFSLLSTTSLSLTIDPDIPSARPAQTFLPLESATGSNEAFKLIVFES